MADGSTPKPDETLAPLAGASDPGPPELGTPGSGVTPKLVYCFARMTALVVALLGGCLLASEGRAGGVYLALAAGLELGLVAPPAAASVLAGLAGGPPLWYYPWRGLAGALTLAAGVLLAVGRPLVAGWLLALSAGAQKGADEAAGGPAWYRAGRAFAWTALLAAGLTLVAAPAGGLAGAGSLLVVASAAGAVADLAGAPHLWLLATPPPDVGPPAA